MEKYVLSVIVPVYNTQKYLDKCITSILRQKYQNLELILVNDGSTDESGKICDKYNKIDSRVKVIHQKNSGLVAARKVGTNVASGEIVTFVDSDDWIEEDMYESMMKVYEKTHATMISSGLIIESIDGNLIEIEQDKLQEGEYNLQKIQREVFPVMMWNVNYKRRSITSSVCCKLFKKDLLQEIIEDIDEELTLGEDAAITYPYCAMAEKIYIFNHSWYHYVCRNDSMVRTYDPIQFFKLYKFENYLAYQFKKLGLEETMSFQLKQYIKKFLKTAINHVYGIEMENVCYVFPYECVPCGSRIILYGAGSVGKSYWNCVSNGEYVQIISWVDQKYQELKNMPIPLEAPETIMVKEYDYIVIAVNDRAVAEQIRDWLLKKGIKEEKIIWKKSNYID